MLLLALMLLHPATIVSPSLVAEFYTTLIRLSTAFLMSSLQWVFVAIFPSVFIWKNDHVRTLSEKLRLFSPSLYFPLILSEIQIGCT